MSALYAAADVRAVEAAAVTALGARHSSYAKAINPSAFNAEPSASQGNNSGQPTSTSPTDVASATPTSDVPILGLSGLRKAELASSSSLVEQAGRATDPELARIMVLAAAGSAAAAEALRMVSYARG
jgi:hypothetical protein